MRTIGTSGVYHPDRETVEGTVLLVEGGRIVDVRGTVPRDATLVHDGEAGALPWLADARSNPAVRPGTLAEPRAVVESEEMVA